MIHNARWKRRRPYVVPDKGEVGQILDRAVGGLQVAEVRLLNDGVFNSNLRVQSTDDRVVVVRIYEQDEEACRRDQVIIDLVRGDVPVPSILGTTQFEGFPVAIFEWIDGVYPDQALNGASRGERKEIARALGSTLAGISRAKRFPAHGLLDAELGYRRRFESNRKSFVDFIDWSLKQGRAGQRLGPELAADLRCFVDERAPLLDATEDDYRLVHGDLRFTNILMGNDGGGWYVRAVLDWEFAMAGSPLLDFGVLLRGGGLGPEFEEAFAQGFVEAGGALPERWREISELLDLRNLCGFLNASKHRGELFAAIRREILRIVDSK